MTTATKRAPRAHTPKAAAPERGRLLYDDRCDRSQIDKACSKDQTRPALCNPWLAYHEGQAYLCGTDSYIAVRLPVTLSGVDGKPLARPALLEGTIPVEAIKEARKQRAVLELDEENAYVYGVSYPRVKHQHPDLAKFLDDFAGALDPFVLGLNPALTKNVADALGTGGGVTIRWLAGMVEKGEGLRPLLLAGTASRDLTGPIAIQMPIKVAP